jgi:probable F420-dependent oxidoreductase
MPLPHLSIQVINFAATGPGDWQVLSDHAVAADQVGVDRLAVSDHVVFGDDLADYADPAKGGTPGGRQPTGPDGLWLEPLTTLTWLAARTTRIRLQTGILLAALRRPVVLAKTTATLDVLSGGRLDLGVGVGWQAAEYEAAGLDFSGRGPLLDQALEVCQALWSQPTASYSGDDLAFEGIHAMPKPVSGDGVPIWVSGTVNRRTARRLARFGMGWIPWGDDRADITGGITRMRSLLAEMGLGHDGFQVQGPVRMVQDSDGTVDLQSTMAGIPDLVESGVTDCRLALRLSPEPEEAADLLGRAVEAFRSAVGRDA